MKIKVKFIGNSWGAHLDSTKEVELRAITIHGTDWYLTPGYEIEVVQNEQSLATNADNRTIRDILGQDLKIIEFK